MWKSLEMDDYSQRTLNISVEAPIAGVYRCELIPTKNPDEFHIDIWYQFAMGMSNEDLLQAYDDAIYLEEGDKVTMDSHKKFVIVKKKRNLRLVVNNG